MSDDLKKYLDPKGLWPAEDSTSAPAKLGHGECWAIEEVAFNDVETAEAIHEWLKELALYGRQPRMDRQLVERLEALFEKNKRLYEPEITEAG